MNRYGISHDSYDSYDSDSTHMTPQCVLGSVAPVLRIRTSIHTVYIPLALAMIGPFAPLQSISQQATWTVLCWYYRPKL